MTDKRFSVLRLLPSFITIISLFFGLTAINAGIDNNIRLAINLILAASICDLLDGRIARLFKVTSEFGGELDSLSDFSTFVIAPGFIVYYCLLSNIYPLGWVTACFYIVAGMLRLARFNILPPENQKIYANFFQGVPVPAAALLSFMPFYLAINYNIIMPDKLVIIYIIIVSLLMISNIPTFSTKKIHFSKPFLPIALALISLFTLSLIYYTINTLLICSALYLLSIPITSAIFYRHKFKLKEKI